MKKAIIYARISVSSDESVSIERQVKSAEQYAAAQGWTVIATHVDEGVSATQNKPSKRPGWRAVMADAPDADVVLIWKLDRLSRRIRDFLETQWALEEHGAGIASVTEALDMTTTMGQIVGNTLAGFAQMEAEAISARVAAARTHLLKQGRAVGGTTPYGWMTLPVPGGPGFLVAQDPEAIGWVAKAAERTLAGHSLYSTVQWLDAEGAPLPSASQGSRKKAGWSYTTLERLLRNPIVAGLTPFNPGLAATERKRRGEDVLRGDDGLPVVNEDLAVLSLADWRRMVRLLDERPTRQALPRASKAKTSGLLSGLVFCGDIGHFQPGHPEEWVRMWRGTTQGRPSFSCPKCGQTISQFEDLVVDQFLAAKGSHVRWTKVEEVAEGGAALLPEIEHRLDELQALIRDASSEDEEASLMRQQSVLLAERRARRAEAPVVSLRYTPAGLFAADWAAASTEGERRAVLEDALFRLVIRRGRPGRRTPEQLAARLEFQWHMPEQVGEPEDRSLTG